MEEDWEKNSENLAESITKLEIPSSPSDVNNDSENLDVLEINKSLRRDDHPAPVRASNDQKKISISGNGIGKQPSAAAIMFTKGRKADSDEISNQQERFVVSEKIPIREVDAPLDTALLSVLETHRNRMQLIDMEATFLTFAKSTAQETFFPPNSNSYWRMVTFRLGDRFGFDHKFASDGSGGTVFFKGDNFALPHTLMMDMDLDTQYKMYDAAGGREGSTVGTKIAPGPIKIHHGDNLHASTNGSSKEKGKKLLKVIQRRPKGDKKQMNLDKSVNGANENNEGTKNNKQLLDKEKAYEEARARILAKKAAKSSSKEETNTDGEESNFTMAMAHASTMEESDPHTQSTQSHVRKGHHYQNSDDDHDPDFERSIFRPQINHQQMFHPGQESFAYVQQGYNNMHQHHGVPMHQQHNMHQHYQQQQSYQQQGYYHYKNNNNQTNLNRKVDDHNNVDHAEDFPPLS